VVEEEEGDWLDADDVDGKRKDEEGVFNIVEFNPPPPPRIDPSER
jgi:hypothetical protein